MKGIELAAVEVLTGWGEGVGALPTTPGARRAAGASCRCRLPH